MVRIQRSKAPTQLNNTRAAKAKAKVATIVSKGAKPKSSDFDAVWGFKPVREALWTMQHKKCCYCERLRDKVRESDIEHFRPKSAVEGCSGAGYWWLAYVWENLFFSCRSCNQEFKKTRFPLQNEKQRCYKPSHDLTREEPLLVNPVEEDPSKYIGYDFADGGGQLVRPFGRDSDGRGKATIDVVGLDRLDLNQERAQRLRHLKLIASAMHAALYSDKPRLIKRYAMMIRQETTASASFAGLSREYFRAHDLEEYVSDD